MAVVIGLNVDEIFLRIRLYNKNRKYISKYFINKCMNYEGLPKSKKNEDESAYYLRLYNYLIEHYYYEDKDINNILSFD